MPRHFPGCPVIERFLQLSAGPYIDDIHDGVPIPAELPHLLGIHLEQQRDFVSMLERLRLNIRQVNPAPRSRGQNTHQRPLRVAIPNLKDVHRSLPDP